MEYEVDAWATPVLQRLVQLKNLSNPQHLEEISKLSASEHRLKLLLILEEAKLSKGTIEFPSYTTREEHLKNITALIQEQGAQYLPDRYQHALDDFGYTYYGHLDDFVHARTGDQLYGKRGFSLAKPMFMLMYIRT